MLLVIPASPFISNLHLTWESIFLFDVKYLAFLGLREWLCSSSIIVIRNLPSGQSEAFIPALHPIFNDRWEKFFAWLWHFPKREHATVKYFTFPSGPNVNSSLLPQTLLPSHGFYTSLATLFQRWITFPPLNVEPSNWHPLLTSTPMFPSIVYNSSVPPKIFYSIKCTYNKYFILYD